MAQLESSTTPNFDVVHLDPPESVAVDVAAASARQSEAEKT